MTTPIDSFHPEKRTLGQILSNTSPAIRVPDYQRDFSWGKEEIIDFWSDLIEFGGSHVQPTLVGREYFLGAAVLVNNGHFHLLLDGQQRLATATILLSALRDQMKTFKENAAAQIQNEYIQFNDHLTGERVSKIELNVFDRPFFRDFIQAFPRVQGCSASKKSHRLIEDAYNYFLEQINDGWKKHGDGKKGFEWAVHVAQTLRDHLVLVTVISTNAKNAASIFTTLNDRGIGLSTVDLIRSFVLQNAAETEREEIIECWDKTFTACGTHLAAEALIRTSWVSEHGDVKTRALYKIVTDTITVEISPLEYSRMLGSDAVRYKQFRECDTDDQDIFECWNAFRVLKFNAAYPLLLAAARVLPNIGDQRIVSRALFALAIRHNVVCGLDRAKLESLAYASAKTLSEKKGTSAVLEELRKLSPDQQQFRESFARLAFTKSNSNIARLMLRAFDGKLSASEEVTIAGSDKVHLEHIYPQTPKPEDRWTNHEGMIGRLGNLTLLDKKFNESIQNAGFTAKKEQAYKDSRLEVTKALLSYTEWSSVQVEQRQLELCELAEGLWPASLV